MASVTNTDAQLDASTLLTEEDAATIEALHTFDRDPNAPFAVSANSAVVTNLDADKLDGVEGASFVRSDAADTVTADITFNDNVNVTLGTGGDADLYYDGTDVVLNTQVVGTGALSLLKGQLKFPATQNASSDANTLDDYEEGTWTPTIGGSGGTSGQTYTTQLGRYIKIGKMVHIQGRVTLSAKGTITTNAEIQGLPFAHVNNGGLSAMRVGYFANLATSVVALSGYFQSNSTAIRLTMLTAAATSMSELTTTDIANNSDIIFAATYEATA